MKKIIIQIYSVMARLLSKSNGYDVYQAELPVDDVAR